VVYAYAEEKGKRARAMTVEEILEMIDKFSDAAWRVKQAGFDMVQLHGAHGYLIAQFMSPYTNRRSDRFGGSFENRMRFPLAIIDQIHEKCGSDFPVSIRYSVDEWIEGGRDLKESVEVAKLFEEAGVVLLDLSQCITETPGAGFDPMYYQQGWTMYASEEIKKHVKIPVVNSHTLREPEFCDSVIAEGNVLANEGLSREGEGDSEMYLVPHRLLAGFYAREEAYRLRCEPRYRRYEVWECEKGRAPHTHRDHRGWAGRYGSGTAGNNSRA
jgi:2,4-dienoyl-CoA reductase-like NADH-dependent reductase (Old Yellow Enzyme family)